MNAVEILATLKKFGNPQTAVHLKRHGAGDNMFRALPSAIVELQKKTKVNHALATELWRTANAEAPVLALQVPTPSGSTRGHAARLLRDGRLHFLGATRPAPRPVVR